ncbi:MAG: type II toxin-antitoxin system RelE/ParE family toxin [Campylobacterales bacterium]|nr:type II toxin-antitoxin system RelE/ParE family toxin [Campylobacterales bacterium]
MKKLSSVVILETEKFSKSIKKLKKRFRHIEDDCEEFIEHIEYEEDLGIHLGDGVYKARIANTDKKSGKSSGYRLISYLKLIDNELYLLLIYDKSDFENLSESEIDKLVLASLR